MPHRSCYEVWIRSVLATSVCDHHEREGLVLKLSFSLPRFMARLLCVQGMWWDARDVVGWGFLSP